jgi:hypothetical protein
VKVPQIDSIPVPVLARFYGIVITMFFRDHNPPHIHAYGGRAGKSAEWAAQIAIRTGVVIAGNVPDVARRLLRDWIRLHEDELLAAWNRALVGQEPGRIAPMRVR